MEAEALVPLKLRGILLDFTKDKISPTKCMYLFLRNNLYHFHIGPIVLAPEIKQNNSFEVFCYIYTNNHETKLFHDVLSTLLHLAKIYLGIIWPSPK